MSTRQRQTRPAPARRAALAALLALGVGGCAPGASSPQTNTPTAVATTLGTEKVTLSMYVESTAPVWQALAKEFQKQFPNVTVDVKLDQYKVVVQNAPRLMTGENSPDLVHLDLTPELVKDGLLTDLEQYAKAYGWDRWPSSQLDSLRISPDGTRRGTGDLYGLGAFFGVQGIYYNKALAARIGMTAPPRSFPELEQLLAAAKRAGITPIVQANAGGEAWITYQNIYNQLADPKAINDWVYNAPRATIDTAEAVAAARTLQDWVHQGYLSGDANAFDYTAMLGRFVAGKALFMILGDWEAANLTTKMGTNVGFFATPPRDGAKGIVAASGPAPLLIPKKAPHPGAAAFFLNWTQTNPAARQVIVDTSGNFPGGDPSLPTPKVPAGSVIKDTQAVFAQLSRDNGVVGVLVAATPGMFASTMTPQIQLLVGGRTTPEKFAASLQKGYEEDLGR
jgi:ABC-type glycerol-3-phosphate transport system substrate-binding protein